MTNRIFKKNKERNGYKYIFFFSLNTFSFFSPFFKKIKSILFLQIFVYWKMDIKANICLAKCIFYLFPEKEGTSREGRRISIPLFRILSN